MSNPPIEIMEALEKAHRYFQPHLSKNAREYHFEAKEAIENALRLSMPDYAAWEKKRINKTIIESLENAYNTGLIKE